MRFRLPLLLLALALGLAATSCNYGAYFIRATTEPMLALEGRMDPYQRRQCLIMFMPGMLDTPDDYVNHGFFADAQAASTRCDLVAVDAHFGYYRGGTLRQRVTEDVLRVAEARGYDEIWLVGISMGGMGSLLVTQVNEGRIRGVVLLAPFLGDDNLVRSIDEAGGLAEWDAPDADDVDMNSEEGFDDALWIWLQGYANAPENRPDLYIAVGTEDRLRPGVGLLAAVLPENRSGTTAGGHNWNTWRVLWRNLLRNPPWDPGMGTPSFAAN
ncbi:MAG: alpha/beta fold hydrolase [Sandaracinaceae bacterium]